MSKAVQQEEEQEVQEAMVTVKPAPRVLTIAKRGIRNTKDFGIFMSLLMSDLVEGLIPPEVGNAAVNAGGKLLKSVELERRFGSTGSDNVKVLQLADIDSVRQLTAPQSKVEEGVAAAV